ncbi:hypothetical protein A6R68_01766, partial [Neotoma lepida]
MVNSGQVTMRDRIGRVCNSTGSVDSLGKMKQGAYDGSYGVCDGYYNDSSCNDSYGNVQSQILKKGSTSQSTIGHYTHATTKLPKMTFTNFLNHSVLRKYILRVDLVAECLVKQMLITNEGAAAPIPK